MPSSRFIRNDKCRYCSKKGIHGKDCLFSPDGYHEEIGDADHCIRCGGTNYGPGCIMASADNKKKIHIHGHGISGKDGKYHCIYCGKVMSGPGKSGGVTGPGCLFSPNGRHQA